VPNLPYDTHTGFGVIVAEKRLAPREGEWLIRKCARCGFPLAVTPLDAQAAARHELPIMDPECAEAYVRREEP
jgi:hypothetical protein